MSNIVELKEKEIIIREEGITTTYSRNYYSYVVPSEEELMNGSTAELDIVLIDNDKIVQSYEHLRVF